MTKKDFELIAHMLNGLDPSYTKEQVIKYCMGYLSLFSSFSPNKFLEACGIEEDLQK